MRIVIPLFIANDSGKRNSEDQKIRKKGGKLPDSWQNAPAMREKVPEKEQSGPSAAVYGLTMTPSCRREFIHQGRPQCIGPLELSRVGHHQFTLIDSLQPPQLGSHFLEACRRTAQHDHLQAEVVRKVDVQRGYDQFIVLMLQLQEALAELRVVVIVDKRERAGGIFRLAYPSVFGERVAEQLANGLATGGKLLLATITIKLIQQIVFQRNGEADNFGHGGGYWLEPVSRPFAYLRWVADMGGRSVGQRPDDKAAMSTRSTATVFIVNDFENRNSVDFRRQPASDEVLSRGRDGNMRKSVCPDDRQPCRNNRHDSTVAAICVNTTRPAVNPNSIAR